MSGWTISLSPKVETRSLLTSRHPAALVTVASVFYGLTWALYLLR